MTQIQIVRLKNDLRKTANLLWADMQNFVEEQGFRYATKNIKYVLTELQSSTAAIWFLDVLDYYKQSPYTQSKTNGNIVTSLTDGNSG